MKLVIRKQHGMFVVDPVDLPGSPRQGWGRTTDGAIADFVRSYQKDLGLEIEVDKTAMPAELERRRRELAKR